jgi:uncharacterized protein (TIGR03067 family)
MMRQISSVLVLVVLAQSAPVSAEVPVMSRAQLQQHATHIVVGKTQKVYSVKTETDDWVDIDSVAEIVVSRVEKGAQIQAGDVVYGRFWNKRWIGKGNPDPHSTGHRGPTMGESVRAYLIRKNGAYDVLLPNGFESSPEAGQEAPGEKGLGDLQGTWDFVYYQESGAVEEAGTKQFVIADSRLEFRAGGAARVNTAVEVDSTRMPKQLTQKFNDGQVYRSIYVLADDYLIVCGIRDGGRPSEFRYGGEKGGEFLIVLKRQP